MIEYIHCGTDGQAEVTDKDRKDATVAYLSQVIDLRQKLELKRSKIAILRDSLSVQSPQITDMPRNPSPPASAMEEKLVRIMTLESEVCADEMKVAGLKARMMGMIGKVEDVQEQMVLIGCFLNLKPVKKLAGEMYIAESRVWKIRRSALISMEDVLDEEGELDRWIRRQKSWM